MFILKKFNVTHMRNVGVGMQDTKQQARSKKEKSNQKNSKANFRKAFWL